MFKKKKRWDKPFPEKLARRVQKISSDELVLWSETTVSDVGRCMSLYLKTHDLSWLDSALDGAEALNAIISELHKRNVV